MDGPNVTEPIPPVPTERSPNRVWRVLEIVLVCGSLIGAGTLGGAAIFSSPATAAGGRARASSSARPTPLSSAERSRIVDELAACLRGAGLEVSDPSEGAPPAIGALSVTSEEGLFVVVIVFPTEETAAGAIQTLPLPTEGQVQQVGRVLIASATPTGSTDRATLEGCASQIG
jgi:hypothetical protein